MSHELNNLIQVALTNLEILRVKAADRPDLAPLIENSLRSVKRMVTLSQTPAVLAAESLPKPNLQIVLVEDDALIRMTMAALLEDMGHAVFQAASGEEALGVLASGADMLITDMHLPDMTGDSLVDAARARQPALAVVIASGDAPSHDNRHIWLQKPFTVARLRAAIKAAIAAA